MKRARVAVLILAGVATALTVAPSRAWSQGMPVYAESPSDALARNVRILAKSPRDFDALIGAGKAALDLGDEQAAAGFFGRAAEVNANSPLAQAGKGAALVASGDPRSALIYFARAQQLGAAAASIGCARGLAYDLLGQQVAAQTDYRAALMGPERDEARRRLALSLAISGDKAQALSTLEPLLRQRDAGAVRVRALVLALNGEVATAKTALDYAMPGASSHMEPFFRRLPTLTTAQKAAAVHLGIFPDSGGAMASNTASEPVGDRLASIEQLLAQGRPEDQPTTPQYGYTAPLPVAVPQPAQPVALASVDRSQIEAAVRSPNNEIIQTERVASTGGRKIWLQLASGSNPNDFPQQFKRIRSREPSLFTGINGFVTDTGSRSRLLIGPFHTPEDARLFADALETVRVNAFQWTSSPDQVVRQLPDQ